jgi:hypothetical protein
MSGRNRTSAQRQRLAYEAARIMAEQGIAEFDRARVKAAQRVGIGDRRSWPNNEEIQEALLQQQRLFQGERRDQELRKLREQALEGMRTLERFSPRLVGPVLTGTGDSTQGVRLHLFAENPEDVAFSLMDRGIPWQEREWTLRYAGGVRRTHPVLTFFAGETPFELVVLPRVALRNAPLDPVTERPDRGADAAEVRRLLEQPPAADAT